MPGTFERIYSAAIDGGNAIAAAADPEVNQNVMAALYADCIIANMQARSLGLERMDFAKINAAIQKRWPKGLERIKNKAWRLRIDAARLSLATSNERN